MAETRQELEKRIAQYIAKQDFIERQPCECHAIAVHNISVELGRGRERLRRLQQKTDD